MRNSVITMIYIAAVLFGASLAAIKTYEDLKGSKINSLPSPLLKGKEGLSRIDFSKLPKDMQEKIQGLSYAEIPDMPSDFSEYYPEKYEKIVVLAYLLYNGNNNWKNVIGYLLLTVDFKDAYVKEFLIKKEYRAAGQGKKLMTMALNDYFKNINPKGKVELRITGDKQNKEMLSKFYSKFGFKLQGEITEDSMNDMILNPANYKAPL